MTPDQLLKAAESSGGVDREVASVEWLAALLCELIANGENGPEVVRPIVARFVELYVRRAKVRNFAFDVQAMRGAQREYFKSRDPVNLATAKKAEKRVDVWVRSMLSPVEQTVTKQRTLFEDSKAKDYE